MKAATTSHNEQIAADLNAIREQAADLREKAEEAMTDNRARDLDEGARQLEAFVNYAREGRWAEAGQMIRDRGPIFSEVVRVGYDRSHAYKKAMSAAAGRLDAGVQTIAYDLPEAVHYNIASPEFNKAQYIRRLREKTLAREMHNFKITIDQIAGQADYDARIPGLAGHARAHALTAGTLADIYETINDGDFAEAGRMIWNLKGEAGGHVSRGLQVILAELAAAS